jgi:hypothetical protein
MTADVQEYLQEWEKTNNPFFPNEMRWDRLKVNVFLKDYKKQLFSKKETIKQCGVSGSYQFYIFEGNSIMVDRDVAKMQEDGWKLAGEVATKFGNNGGMPRMIVPLKRKI